MKKLSQSRLADTVMNGRKEKGMTQAQLAGDAHRQVQGHGHHDIGANGHQLTLQRTA